MGSRKIIINGWFLQFPFTGIGQYTINILREFSRSEEFTSGRVEFIVAAPHQACVTRMQEEEIALPVEIVPTVTWGGASIQKHMWEQYHFPKFCREHSATTVWLPYPCVRWLGAQPYRTIVTVHDVIPWTMPAYSTGLLSRLAHAMSRHTLLRADEIITVSEASAREISSVCYVPLERLHVIHNGVAEIFFHRTEPALLDETLHEFGLVRGKYFLYVGGYDVRKGVGKLVESYRSAVAEQATLPTSSSKLPLVLVGGKIHESGLYDDFDATLRVPPDSATPNSIIRTGFLSEEKLNALYDGARGFIHLSEAEGFNIPLAQALVKGLPCAVSDIPVHHEIAGDRAVYVDINSSTSLAAMWGKMCEPTSENKPSPLPPETFSWKKSAHSHLELLM